jgi:hypothetical protein
LDSCGWGASSSCLGIYEDSSTSRIVGREENMTVIGDDVRITGKGRAEIQ